jgi:putative nucleotidyltransferase with HDIG domain
MPHDPQFPSADLPSVAVVPGVDTRHDDLRALIEMACESDLATIRETVLQIVQIVDDPRSSAGDLTNIIATDPPLSARLLRLANSASFGLTRRISSIHDAIICIGFEAVKEIALTQKVCEIFAEEDEGFGYSRFGLWQHSVAVAICARQLSRKMRRGPRPETAYAVGLLHDLGLLVVDQFLPFDFLVVLRSAMEEDCDLTQVEEMVLGFNHGDVGMALVREWQFPKELAYAIGHHHSPLDAPERYQPLCAVVYVAETLLQRLGPGFADLRRRNPALLASCLRQLGLKEDALVEVMTQVREALDDIRGLGWYRGQTPQ